MAIKPAFCMIILYMLCWLHFFLYVNKLFILIKEHCLCGTKEKWRLVVFNGLSFFHNYPEAIQNFIF